MGGVGGGTSVPPIIRGAGYRLCVGGLGFGGIVVEVFWRWEDRELVEEEWWVLVRVKVEEDFWSVVLVVEGIVED